MKKFHTGEVTDEEIIDIEQNSNNTKVSRDTNLSRLDADNVSNNANDINQRSSSSRNSGFVKSEGRGSVVPKDINRSYNITEIMEFNQQEQIQIPLLKIVPMDDVEPTIKVLADSSQRGLSPVKPLNS